MNAATVRSILSLLPILVGTTAIASTGVPDRGLERVPAGETAPALERLYGASHALIIGVSQYDNGWTPLPGVKNDVVAVEQALTAAGYQTEVVPSPRTLDELDHAFSDFIHRRGQGASDRLLIYYAGHGHTLPRKLGGAPLGYLVPGDAPDPAVDAGAFDKAALSMKRIEEYALRIQSRHALFVFDSCFSGSIFPRTRSMPPPISYRATQPVRQFITAGTANERVPDESIFRKQFTRGLAGAADRDNDGFVTGSELGKFLHERVKEESGGRQHPQHGKLNNPDLDKGDFIVRVNLDVADVNVLLPQGSPSVPPGYIPQTGWISDIETLVDRWTPALQDGINRGADTLKGWLKTLLKIVLMILVLLTAVLVWLIRTGRMRRILAWINE